VYHEKSKADTIYLIYSGECELFRGNKSNTSVKPSQKKINFNTQTRILTCLQGDFAGFEALDLGENNKYHSTLVVSYYSLK